MAAVFSDRFVGSSAIVYEVAHLPFDFLITGCAGMWPRSVLIAFCARSLSAGGSSPLPARTIPWLYRLACAPPINPNAPCGVRLPRQTASKRGVAIDEGAAAATRSPQFPSTQPAGFAPLDAAGGVVDGAIDTAGAMATAVPRDGGAHMS
jgi:hypothetical protein